MQRGKINALVNTYLHRVSDPLPCQPSSKLNRKLEPLLAILPIYFSMIYILNNGKFFDRKFSRFSTSVIVIARDLDRIFELLIEMFALGGVT